MLPHSAGVPCVVGVMGAESSAGGGKWFNNHINLNPCLWAALSWVPRVTAATSFLLVWAQFHAAVGPLDVSTCLSCKIAVVLLFHCFLI